MEEKIIRRTPLPTVVFKITAYFKNPVNKCSQESQPLKNATLFCVKESSIRRAVLGHYIVSALKDHRQPPIYNNIPVSNSIPKRPPDTSIGILLQ